MWFFVCLCFSSSSCETEIQLATVRSVLSHVDYLFYRRSILSVTSAFMKLIRIVAETIICISSASMFHNQFEFLNFTRQTDLIGKVANETLIKNT